MGDHFLKPATGKKFSVGQGFLGRPWPNCVWWDVHLLFGWFVITHRQFIDFGKGLLSKAGASGCVPSLITEMMFKQQRNRQFGD